MTEPDDRELQDYLRGDSKLSRTYRAAGGEKAPEGLDDLILARAREHARPRPNWTRVLTPYALAASVLLGVNLAWNVYQQQPLPPEAIVPPGPRFPAPDSTVSAQRATAEGPAQEQQRPEAFPRPPPAAKAAAPVAAAPVAAAPESKLERQQQVVDESPSVVMQPPPSVGNLAAPAPSAPAMRAKALADEGRAESESARIERLIDYVRRLDGAVFIRNGREYTPAEAAEHLQLKWRQAGARVRTADDFIFQCVSRSPIAGEPYSIRFADGSERSAADVLLERLAAGR